MAAVGQTGRMQELSKGANCPTPAATVTIRVACSSAVDVSALLLGDTGRVRDDDDFVFYNHPTAPGVTYLPGQAGEVDAVRVETASVPAGVEKVVVTASLDGSGPETFASAGSMVVTVLDEALTEQIRYDITGLGAEKALVCVEVYKRADAWKIRAVGQGYDAGLAGIAADFGITVEDEPASPPPVLLSSPPVSSAPPPDTMTTLDSGKVSLVKNQTVSLVKRGAPPLTLVAMGVGWDPAARGRRIDLDASVIAFDADGRDVEKVWFMHKQAFGGAIRHSGDNLTGQGEGDDETINVDLSKVPPNVTALVFTVTSYGGQKLSAVSRASCRLLDITHQPHQELVRFDLSETQGTTGVVMCAMVRTPDGSWSMTSIGAFHDGKTVKKLIGPARALLHTL